MGLLEAIAKALCRHTAGHKAPWQDFAEDARVMVKAYKKWERKHDKD